MLRPVRLTAGCLAIGVAVVALDAQEVKLRGAEAAIASNQRALQYYTWKSRREIVLAGDVQQVTVSAAHFDDDGNIVRIASEDESADTETGPLRKRRTKKKQQKATAFGEQLDALRHSYTGMDRQRLQEVLRESKIRRGEGQDAGTLHVQARNVVRQGDTMNITIDGVTKLRRRFEVMTSLNGEAVSLTVEFRKLDSGPNYPERIVVETELKEDKLVIVTENSDYEIR